ncbi:MAG TPA: YwbE family protein [bacterium]|jgi:uncharacterized repeat protein (TIGR03833 family)|nr:YwbE family protein [bacterium]HNT64342.1 YwbE family protein [bacterium]HOX85332.1 YwbE family protein [bacterium]HPG44491.1 YwbE family protein [bacterium]HPM97049.1 YwbE family protein [bacterium]
MSANESSKPVSRRQDLHPGLLVAIVQKADQSSGKLTVGVVQDILTRAAVHSRGIKVRLESGEIGRVQEILDLRAAE